MVNLDQDHAAIRCRHDATKPLNQISIMALGTGTPRAYIYEMTEAPAAFAKSVSLNFVSMLDHVGATYPLTANTKYYIVAVADEWYTHEKFFEQVVIAGANLVTFSDPPGTVGGSTSSIILTIDGTMPA